MLFRVAKESLSLLPYKLNKAGENEPEREETFKGRWGGHSVK